MKSLAKQNDQTRQFARLTNGQFMIGIKPTRWETYGAGVNGLITGIVVKSHGQPGWSGCQVACRSIATSRALRAVGKSMSTQITK